MTQLEKQRFIERLSEGIHTVTHAASSGATHVLLDRDRALIITTDLHTWGRDLSRALPVSPQFDVRFLANPNAEVATFADAWDVLLSAMQEELDHLTKMV